MCARGRCLVHGQRASGNPTALLAMTGLTFFRRRSSNRVTPRTWRQGNAAAPFLRKATAMPITQDDMIFAAMQQSMSDEEFLQAWHAAVTENDEQRIAVIESAATRRFGLATWHHRYAARFPGQTRYRLPTKW